MKNIQHLIIADDLTGANDAGVHFLSGGDPVSVITDPLTDTGIQKELNTPSVVLNTDTRFLTPEKAYEAVQKCVAKYDSFRPERIYKKIDSTLRGNVGAEIDAVMDCSDYNLACVVPSAPRNRRTITGGLCYIDDVPLDKTEIANDPFSPVRTSDVREIVLSQTEKKVDLFPLDVIRSDFETALEYLEKLRLSGAEIVVADSETFEDLQKVFRIFSSMDEKVLFAGSAGFFHAVSLLSRRNKKVSQEQKNDDGKILLAVGSLMGTTRKQVEWIKERNSSLRIHSLVTKNIVEELAEEAGKIALSLKKDLESGYITLLQTEYVEKAAAGDALKISAFMGEVLRNLLDETELDTLVVTGGDTSLNVLKQLKVRKLDLVDELLPGIPVSEIEIPGYGKKMTFITKAGSYGEVDAFEGVINYIKRDTEKGENK